MIRNPPRHNVDHQRIFAVTTARRRRPDLANPEATFGRHFRTCPEYDAFLRHTIAVAQPLTVLNDFDPASYDD